MLDRLLHHGRTQVAAQLAHQAGVREKQWTKANKDKSKGIGGRAKNARQRRDS